MVSEKVLKAVELQKRANSQIEVYGQTSEDVVDQLMEIVDSLTPEEQTMFLQMYN